MEFIKILKKRIFSKDKEYGMILLKNKPMTYNDLEQYTFKFDSDYVVETCFKSIRTIFSVYEKDMMLKKRINNIYPALDKHSPNGFILKVVFVIDYYIVDGEKSMGSFLMSSIQGEEDLPFFLYDKVRIERIGIDMCINKPLNRNILNKIKKDLI